MLWDPLNIWPEARRWIWATLAFWICLIQGPGFVENLWESRDALPDFFQEWASARNRFEGLAIYTTHDVTIPRYLGSLGETVHPLVQVNAHPPTSVLLALPFGRLDFHTAFFVWNLISLPPLGFSLWLVARELKIQVSAWAVFPFLALLLTCGPVRQEIHMGQLNLFLLPMIAGAWAAERSGRPRLAGVLLATATAVKLFPAFLIVYYAYRRRWQLVATSLVALAALTGLTAAVLGIECYRDYFLNVVPEIHWFRVGWHNASFTGFWSRLFDPAPERFRTRSWSEPLFYSPMLARAAAWMSDLVLILVLAKLTQNPRSRAAEDISFGLAATAMLLISPITWNHYFVLLLAPSAIFWLHLPASIWARVSFLIVVAALWVFPDHVWTFFDLGGTTARPISSVTVISYQMYALLGLFALGARELSVEGTSSARIGPEGDQAFGIAD